MINRYTLEFRDQRLENMYQEFQLEHKRKPLAKVIILLAFLIIIIQGTFSIIQNNQYYLYSAAGLLGANACFLLTFYKRPQFLRYLFQGISYVLILYYIQIEANKSQFHYQLATVIILGFQFVIIATGEFLDALFQIFVIYSAYLIYFIKYQENFSYALVASTFMIELLLINSFYKNVSAERSKFQLTLIEDQWDQILFNTITQPSIIFSFDLIKHSFVLKKSIKFTYSCENTNELKQFLRTALVKENTMDLEKHIYQCLNTLKRTHDKIINERLLINFQKSIQEIKYSIFPGASPIILIQICQGSSTKEFEKIEKLYQFKYITLLRTLQLKTKKMFLSKTNNFHEILKIVLYKNLSESKQMSFLKKLNLKQILNIIKILYRNRQLKFIVNNTCMNCIIDEVNVLIMILIEIFESIVSYQIFTHINLINNDLLEFKIIGEFTEKTINNFNKRSEYFLKYQIQLQIDEREISFQMKNNQIDVYNKII